jgi:hypothetical protein
MHKKIIRKSFILIFILSAISFSSCATNVGNPNVNDFGKLLEMEKSVSTKSDVYDSFGQPHDVDYIANNESMWTYFHSKMTMSGATFVPFIGLVAGGSNADTSIMDFYFDNSGVYQKISRSNSTKYVNQWVGIAKGVNELATDKKHERVAEEMKKLNLPFDKEVANSVKDIGIVSDQQK